MHTDSSASITYLASASASECTATVLMPISRHARMMRSAISPRLAIRIFEIITLLEPHREELFAVLDRLPVLRVDAHDRAVDVRLDLVHQLHRLDDAEHLPLRDVVADVHVYLGFGVRRAVERPDDRRGDDVQPCFALLL